MRTGVSEFRKIIVACCAMYDTIMHELDRRQIMTEYNFDEFEEGPVEPIGKRINVTINRHGNFYINRKAILAMGEPDAVVLFFDTERKIIGMQRSPIGRTNAFPLNRRSRSKPENARVIHAGNFCSHHNITPDATIRFADPQVNKDGIMILDMTKTAVVTRDSR